MAAAVARGVVAEGLQNPTASFEVQRLVIRSFDEMKELVGRWYSCPKCHVLTRGRFLSDRITDGPSGHLVSVFGLDCGCTFDDVEEVPVLGTKVAQKDISWLFLSFEVKDPAGVVHQRLWQRAHSYLANYTYAFQSLSGLQSPTYTYLNTGWTSTATTTSSISLANGYFEFYTQGPSNSALYGMGVGTGNAANTTTTAALAIPITNGTGAGQMTWANDTETLAAVSGSTVSYTHVRTFTNNSGATITIAEAGLTGKIQSSNGLNGVTILFIRDVLGTAVGVGNGLSATGTYTIGITVS